MKMPWKQDCCFNAFKSTRDWKFFFKHHFRVEETWSMDYSFATWLYEHIRGYILAAEEVVDLHYHKFEIEGVEYSQYDIMLWILDDLEVYLKDDSLWGNTGFDRLKEAAYLWSEILPAMWW